MKEEQPQIGVVIRHLYLWRDEARRGVEEGRKARPCVIVHTRRNKYNNTEVYIDSITHTMPRSMEHAIEIPLATKHRLKLDHERSWIITNEVNRFTWKGPDIRSTPAGKSAYGHLPPGLTRATIEQISRHARQKDMSIVGQDEKPEKKI